MASRNPSSAELTRGHRKRARTRDSLVSAALEIFARKGEAASINEIAAEAGVSNGTFYNHFTTREDLLDAVGTRLLEVLADQIALSYAVVKDPAERIAIANRRILLQALAHPNWGWVIVRMAGSARSLSSRIEAYALADLRAGARQGRFHVRPDRAALDLVIGTVLAGMRSILEGKAGAGHASAIAALMLRGLGVPAEEADDLTSRPLPTLPLKPTDSTRPAPDSPRSLRAVRRNTKVVSTEKN